MGLYILPFCNTGNCLRQTTREDEGEKEEKEDGLNS
jgi:hypothetical protein